MPVVQVVGRVVIVGLLATAVAGCNGPGSSGDAGQQQSAVGQVGKMLAVYQKGGLKPPSRGAKALPVYQKGPVPPPRGMGDLEPMAKGFPLAFGALRSREVLIYWQTDLTDGSDASSTVLAFAREVPEQGGEVLMRDGSTRRMSASEFRDAKKPTGAKTDDAMPIPSPKSSRP